MEVSSHSLAMQRVHGLTFAAATFTNLTQDHLDFHGSMEEYFRAKKILFDQLSADARAISNNDDPRGAEIVSTTAAQRVMYGTVPTADVFGMDVTLSIEGTRLGIVRSGVRTDIASPLIGGFNAANILACYATCASLGVNPKSIVDGIGALQGVRGRFERVGSPEGWIAVIDYAHTPDALENCLRTVRGVIDRGKGRVITLFGCGGDRDRGKRPLMGKIASEFSDIVIITSDNPRSEDPVSIMKEIRKGITDASDILEEPDRRAAIALALGMARKGDVVLIAGKGHETWQVFADRREHFDDREEVERFNREKSSKHGGR
jgi:UDP-N-acetylmuramoyl-L-alanyl-D-glutamate--2,6-diaminopimelate ligase